MKQLGTRVGAVVAASLVGTVAHAAPDLVVSAASGVHWIVDGDRTDLAVTITNAGPDPASGVLVQAALTPTGTWSGAAVVCEVNVGAVAARSSVDATAPCALDTDVRGEAVLTVRVDPRNTVPESNEGNNTLPLDVFVADTAAAELVVLAANPPVSATPGEVFELPYAIRNEGRRGAANVRVRARLSTDTDWDLTDPELCVMNVLVLGAGNGAVRTLTDCTVPTNAPSGDGYVLVRVDALNSVAEWQDDNNTLAVPIVLAAARGTGSPTFTGDVAHDFAGLPITRLVDNAGPDQQGLFAWTSGFDLRQVIYSYDTRNDRLHVGFVTWDDPTSGPIVFGDADGNGDPDTTGAGAPGTDVPDLGNGETVDTLFDIDGVTVAEIFLGTIGQLPDSVRTIAGVSLGDDLAVPRYAWQIGSPSSTDPGTWYDFNVRNASVSRISTPTASAPDLELTIDGFLDGWRRSPSAAPPRVTAWAWANTTEAPAFGPDAVPDSRTPVRLCLGDGADGDGDGYAACDCDDDDASTHPGAWELCDGQDNDCDGQSESVVLGCVTDPDNDGLSNTRENSLGTDPNNPDSDGDGLSDGEEVDTYGTLPRNPDTDGGGDLDGEEIDQGTDPTNGTDDDRDDDGLDARGESQHGTLPGNPDTDGDGLNDGDEVARGTDPTVRDTDGDGLSDGVEVEITLTDPLLADTDGGGVDDGDEIADGTNPFDDTDEDPDGDGLTNGEEDAWGTDRDDADSDDDDLDDGDEIDRGTNPLDADTDDGGVPDGDEVAEGTDPLDEGDDDPDGDGLDNDAEDAQGTDRNVADTDHDGLNDGDEVGRGTNPLDPDSDDDDVLDGAEVRDGTNPLVADTDGGGDDDGEERDQGTDPLDAGDDDPDDDGLDNDEERAAGTDAHDPDSDDDGLLDGEEIDRGTLPLDPDTDDDGLEDGDEVDRGTNPNDPDSDDGGVEDGDEVAGGYDPLDPTDDASQIDTDTPVDTDTDVPGDTDTDVPGDTDSDTPADTDTVDTDITDTDTVDTDGLDTDDTTDVPGAEAPKRWFCSTSGGDPTTLWVLALGLLAIRRRRR
ncbi:MAG: hypothetical protein H6733_12965 [Alphaproteobacteria bacterium]|nr:hypothetical protein [Alphaproteobacteria bacterium]